MDVEMDVQLDAGGPLWTSVDIKLDTSVDVSADVKMDVQMDAEMDAEMDLYGRRWTAMDLHGHDHKRPRTCPWTLMDLRGPSIWASKKKSNNVQDPKISTGWLFAAAVPLFWKIPSL